MTANAMHLPPLNEVDWQRVAAARLVLIGAGAVGRPLARGLVQLGLRRAVVVDPKRYRERSILSQCQPGEVGQLKAEVVAAELAALGAEALALPRDVEQVPPGYFENSFVVVSVDNRRAEIIANRQAARMRRPVMKVNVEPLFLTASLRFYDLSGSPADVCLECQMSDAHYADQHHPLSCDGEGAGRPTASPRPLCELAANAAALAIAQIIGSPHHWARAWRNRQWQANLLGGQSQLSELPPKPACRWDHASHWPQIAHVTHPLSELTLGELVAAANAKSEDVQVRFSSPVTTRQRCTSCGQSQSKLRWLNRLDEPLEKCSCGGDLLAMPFFCRDEFSLADLQPWLAMPLADWGVEAESIITVGPPVQPMAFLLRPPSFSKYLNSTHPEGSEP